VKTFSIADKLELPLDAVTERLGWLGQSGSGKTYGAMRLAELMLEAGAQIVALDPVGVWKGLRTSADGKAPGFPVVVIGGEAGDVPIAPNAGEAVADLVVDRGVSAVLDVSDFTVGEQITFVAAFAERLFDKQKKVKRPMHLFVEEAHTFMPQDRMPDPKATLMLHRMVRVIRVGRNHGIGSSIISQQPQSVSKAALNQVSCLFAMRTLGTRERKAIDEWFGDKAGDESDFDLVKQLSKLETGEAIVASPSWLKGTKRVRITRKTTYDSSATPKFGQQLAPQKVLAPVDVQQLRVALADLVSQAEKDDPAVLRRRIAELERVGGKPVEVEKRVEVPVYSDQERAEITELRRQFIAMGEQLGLRIDRLVSLATSKPVAPPTLISADQRRLDAISKWYAKRGEDGASEPVETPMIGGLKKGARDMLRELVALGGEVSRRDLGTRVGLKAGTGTFRAYVGALKGQDFVEIGPSGDLIATAKGRAEVPEAKAASSRELAALWGSKMKRGARQMLEALMEAYPKPLSKAQLASAAGIEEGTGTFRAYIGANKSSGCADQTGPRDLVAGHALFLGER
jgi:hypothetical protein